MKNQFKIPLVLFLIGMIISVVGALFKLMHWPGANIILIMGMLIEAGAILSLIITIVKKNKMNKNRLEAFSDGVLAIIITIMVLNLKFQMILHLNRLLNYRISF